MTPSGLIENPRKDVGPRLQTPPHIGPEALEAQSTPPIMPIRGRGRPRKNTTSIRSLDHIQHSSPSSLRHSKSRGTLNPSTPCSREPNSGGPSIEPQSQHQNSDQNRGPYFTRATKAWLLRKSLGLEFQGSDDQAIKGISHELIAITRG